MAYKNKKNTIQTVWPDETAPVEQESKTPEKKKIVPSGDFYTQCRLIKKTKDSHTEQISFIPSEFAIRESFLKVKDAETGEFSDGWEVVSIGIKLPKEQVQIYRDVYRHTRDASDA